MSGETTDFRVHDKTTLRQTSHNSTSHVHVYTCTVVHVHHINVHVHVPTTDYDTCTCIIEWAYTKLSNSFANTLQWLKALQVYIQMIGDEHFVCSLEADK